MSREHRNIFRAKIVRAREATTKQIGIILVRPRPSLRGCCLVACDNFLKGFYGVSARVSRGFHRVSKGFHGKAGSAGLTENSNIHRPGGVSKCNHVPLL